MCVAFFFFKQKTAYELRISDWSSDVCSSDLNDLLVAYVFLGGTSDNRVVTIALQMLSGSRGQDWHLLTSAAFITMALPLLVFFMLQRYFVRGLTAGAVKG